MPLHNYRNVNNSSTTSIYDSFVGLVKCKLGQDLPDRTHEKRYPKSGRLDSMAIIGLSMVLSDSDALWGKKRKSGNAQWALWVANIKKMEIALHPIKATYAKVGALRTALTRLKPPFLWHGCRSPEYICRPFQILEVYYLQSYRELEAPTSSITMLPALHPTQGVRHICWNICRPCH